MSVNFFNSDCSENPRSETLFGICDEGNKAYTDILNPDNWIAIVINENEIDITFTAIDQCFKILKENSKDQESLCDGMLTFKDALYLIELKDQMTGGWLPDAIGQLKNTIKLLDKDDLSTIKFKKAFACNKKHSPRFNSSINELNKRLFRKYGFRIEIQSKIKIK
jgi:hypothetical protein